ncbi:MAG: ribosome biogenesis GTP-binding protein YihA/YsxC [Ilyomonas sp.]
MIIKKAEYLISSANVEQCPKPDKPEYPFIGRSNVGKSSLINMLSNNNHLAKTSASPGKTQLINHFIIESSAKEKAPVEKWYLVDLPGYGFAKVSQKDRRRWEQMIENYLRKRENIITVFVLVDSRHEPQKIDLDFINNLGKWQIPFTIVFTKADKEKPKALENNVKSFFDAMRESWQFLPPGFITSAEKKTGREALLDYIQECNDNVRK